MKTRGGNGSVVANAAFRCSGPTGSCIAATASERESVLCPPQSAPQHRAVPVGPSSFSSRSISVSFLSSRRVARCFRPLPPGVLLLAVGAASRFFPATRAGALGFPGLLGGERGGSRAAADRRFDDMARSIRGFCGRLGAPRSARGPGERASGARRSNRRLLEQRERPRSRRPSA